MGIELDYLNCHGCSLCLLSCPMWLQKRDVRFSPQGFAKALQHGASVANMIEELSACIDCGTCDLLCPEKIDLTGMIAEFLGDKMPEIADDIFAKLCHSNVQNNLVPSDFYVIDARPFHAHHAKRVEFYDSLRQSTGCSMNLDLNRMAIATGIDSTAEKKQRFDVEQQIQWLIQGRNFNRMVVENLADQSKLAEITGKNTIHISELLR